METEQLGKITLIHGDCMDYMRTLPDKAFDLAIVDPPYGISVTKMNLGNGKNRIYRGDGEWDSSAPSPEYFTELFRVSKNQIIWGANHFISRIPYDSSCWIVWDKGTGENSFADCELAWTSFTCPVRKYFKSWVGGNAKERQDTIRIHPTQKPVALYHWLLTKFGGEGGVLDTHGGSMSHAIAAHDLGMELTIIEKDDEYYSAARERLIRHQRQLKLEI